VSGHPASYLPEREIEASVAAGERASLARVRQGHYTHTHVLSACSAPKSWHRPPGRHRRLHFSPQPDTFFFSPRPDTFFVCDALPQPPIVSHESGYGEAGSGGVCGSGVRAHAAEGYGHVGDMTRVGGRT